ncbi:MAG: FAD-dependent oxidoreductase [Candidatus Odinarchaeota archaeon]|nr:FAD-dependent oxidoreductase [Candidatus Odinarchaeota archaeon]
MSTEIDLVIIGGGPAGLSAAIHGTRLGLETVVLESKNVGGKVLDIRTIEDYPAIRKISGMELISAMKKQALENGAKIKELEEVLKIDFFHGKKRIVSSKDMYFAKTIIIATGGKYKRLGIPGEEKYAGKDIFYSIVPSNTLFKGKRVAVIGNGDIAVFNALLLTNIAETVYLICSDDELRASMFPKRKVIKSDVDILQSTDVTAIIGDRTIKKITLVDKITNETKELEVDSVFINLGLEPESDIARKIGVAIDNNKYIIVDKKQRTNIPGVFAAGYVTNGVLKIAIAVGEGTMAAISAYEYLK